MDSKMDSFWEDPPTGHGRQHSSQYERNLNFSTVAVEDNEYGFPKKKTVRDPLSHRIIEKRRRDRMNNCLADLARLLPPSSLRKGRGRIEKTEIVELAIKHLRHLQCHPCPHSDNCEYNQIPLPRSNFSAHQKSSLGGSSSSSNSSGGQVALPPTSTGTGGSPPVNSEEQFRLGFQESVSEMMHFLVEHEGMYAGENICVRLVQHLNRHCDNLLRDHIGNNSKLALGFTVNARTNSTLTHGCGGGSISSGFQANCSDGDGSSGPKLLPPLNQSSGHLVVQGVERVEGQRHVVYDYEGDANSCSSADPLSIEIYDTYSQDGKTGVEHGAQAKPPIPVLIGSHSSSNNSGSPPVNLSSSTSDEGNSSMTTCSASIHRYKFKNNIKQRFNADLQTVTSPYPHGHHHHNHQYYHSTSHSTRKFSQSRVLNDKERGGVSSQNIDSLIRSNESDCCCTKETSSDMSSSTQKDRHENSQIEQEMRESQRKSSEDLATTEAMTPSQGKDGEDTQRLTSPSPHDTMRIDEEEQIEEIVDKKPALEDLIPLPSNLLDEPKSLQIAESVSSPTKTIKGVPAFALHNNGLFYIPLTIDESMVSPFIAAMEQNILPPPLHPVTISVCFMRSSEGKKIGEGHSHSPKFSIPIPTTSGESGSIVESTTSIMTCSPITTQVHTTSHMSHPPSSSNSRDTTNSFIMNRFTQSQVPMPMLYGSEGSRGSSSSNGGGGKSGRYPQPPLSSCGGGQSMTSSYNGGIGGELSSSNSGISQNIPYQMTTTSESCGSGTTFYHSSTIDSSSAGSQDSSSPSRAGCRSTRKRSISVSPSISLGYHSWNEKTAGSGSDIFIGNSRSMSSEVGSSPGLNSIGQGQRVIGCGSSEGAPLHYTQSSKSQYTVPQVTGSSERREKREHHYPHGCPKRFKKKSRIEEPKTTTACYMPTRKYVPST